MSRSWGKYFFVALAILLVSAAIVVGGQRQKRRLDRTTKNYATQVLNITENKPFVVVICSWNNEEYIENNLMSALSQTYPNYRIIYIDDASTDNTYEMAKDIIAREGAEDKVTLLHNSENCGAMSNTFRAVHTCSNDEIIVILDGDDQLDGTDVLTKLNGYYNNPDVWMTYGQCKSSLTGELGMARPLSMSVLKSGRIKKKAWVTSHLRSFYAGLFKRIKLRDFTYKGAFVPMAADVAAMLPMVEMAGEHTFYISEPLYIYNDDNPRNDHRISESRQEFYNQYLRSLPPYEVLKTPPWEKNLSRSPKSDLMTFSYDRPMQLYAFLESVDKYVSHVGNSVVVFRASAPEYERGYEIVKKQFPDVTFIQQNHQRARKEFKSIVMKYGFDRAFSQSDHIVFSTDDIVIKDYIDLSLGIHHLEKTKAYGFYYRLGKRIDYCYMGDFKQTVPDLLGIGSDIYAWEYSQVKENGDWKYPNSVDFVLYPKGQIMGDLASIRFTFPNDMESMWHNKANLKRMGLCHSEPKLVNLPLNIVSNYNTKGMIEYPAHELLAEFLSGNKMDIEPLHSIQNRGVHMDYHPTFIERVDK